jgi:hypothetical protein
LRQDRKTDLPAIVKARLLAGQDDQTIARSVGTLPESIACYEQLFFNVRDRLDVEDWIVQVVLAGELRHSSQRAVSTTTEHRRLLYRLAGSTRSRPGWTSSAATVRPSNPSKPSTSQQSILDVTHQIS